jgi:hypothetical protein
VKVFPSTARWSVNDWRLLARHLCGSTVTAAAAACRQSAGADLAFVAFVVVVMSDGVSSGEGGGVGKGPGKLCCCCFSSGLSRGELGSEDTERMGEADRGGMEEEELLEEEEVERPPASESVKEVLIPSMEWKFRLVEMTPPVR